MRWRQHDDRAQSARICRSSLRIHCMLLLQKSIIRNKMNRQFSGPVSVSLRNFRSILSINYSTTKRLRLFFFVGIRTMNGFCIPFVYILPSSFLIVSSTASSLSSRTNFSFLPTWLIRLASAFDVDRPNCLSHNLFRIHFVQQWR